MNIVKATHADLSDWARLRHALWPSTPELEHFNEARALLGRAGLAAAFLASPLQSRAVGLAEVTLRHDHVNGCTTSPVAFLEGLYVESGWRRLGVARRLSEAIECWALGIGCQELASDALFKNLGGRRAHRSLGFEETERVVYFRKPLDETS